MRKEKFNNNMGDFKKVQNLKDDFTELKKKARQKGIPDNVIYKIISEKSRLHPNIYARVKQIKEKITNAIFCTSIFCVLLSVFLALFLYQYETTSTFVLVFLSHYLKDFSCLVNTNFIVIEVARPKTNCTPCANLSKVPVEYNITKDKFLGSYAYTNVPVLVKEATSNWTAMDKFSFKFFQDLYNNHNGSFEKNEEECQFFPYNTEFTSLRDALNISDSRAQFQEGEKPWYIGWSNCHKGIADILRHHYQKPYFLPAESESSRLDWIFMGGPGPGAVTHIDMVERPSWQAQISGTKVWTLIPTPECESVCNTMKVTVQKGDIISLDTNQWYHHTEVLPGEISITIGSEYD